MNKISRFLFGEEQYPGQWRNDYLFSIILLGIATIAVLFLLSKI